MKKLKWVIFGIIMLFLLVYISITLFLIGTSGVYVRGYNPAIIAMIFGIITIIVTGNMVINCLRLLHETNNENE